MKETRWPPTRDWTETRCTGTERPGRDHPSGAPSRCTVTATRECSDMGASGRGTSTRAGRRWPRRSPNGINAGLCGIPYWGTDIGGFVPTRELTGELYVRWFQFSAFCPLFRSHGRAWKLRLPWGWNLGTAGPLEGSEALGDWPRPQDLHNAQVEPICRKYLELRYELLPYIYSAVEQAHRTGMPLMRALWLTSQDEKATLIADQYLWGDHFLVAPVLEPGATRRKIYLPAGNWWDFWSNQKTDGGAEIACAVDLSMIPLYVCAGAIVPMGPVRQHAMEPSREAITLVCIRVQTEDPAGTRMME